MQLPNHTQVSNAFIERMGEYSGAEVKVFLAICRKTIGWHKTTDKISYTQLTEMTGIKHRQTLNEAIHELEKGGWITIHGDSKRGYTYDLNFQARSISERPQAETRSLNDETGSKSERKHVQKVNPQKKERNYTKERGDFHPPERTPPPSEFLALRDRLAERMDVNKKELVTAGGGAEKQMLGAKDTAEDLDAEASRLSLYSSNGRG